MDGGQHDNGGDELSRLIATRAAQAAKDSEVLAAASYVADALERLASAVDDLQAVRWAALAADEVAAAVRGLARQQARLDAAMLASVKAVDDRDDVVPGGRPRTAGARFLQHALGLDRKVAARHADAARLLDRDTGDLAAVGQAYAAGQISRGHVDLATGVHRRLRARIREALVPVADPVTGEESEQRCIQVVDAVLARQAQALSVPETQRAATRLVEHLDPPSPEGAHERRYLHLSQLPDGSLVGRFACGPAQALAFQAVIDAGAAPQPGRAVDADGVERDLRDERTIAQRRMDALSDALNASATHASASDTTTTTTTAAAPLWPATAVPTRPTVPTKAESSTPTMRPTTSPATSPTTCPALGRRAKARSSTWSLTSGKTEAYLGLAAYTFAIRRRQGVVGVGGQARTGATGVAVLMRYTLRLLTAQQFQRAATLVCATELLRRRDLADGSSRWGDEPFRVGLWVGSKVTPNWYDEAEQALDEARNRQVTSGAGSPIQVLACPWCGRAIHAGQDAEAIAAQRRVLVWCGDPDGLCPFSRKQSAPFGEGIPVVTVDEEVFRLAPALVIGTVDKFAQLPMRGWTGMLFGQYDQRCARHGFMHPDLGDRIGCGPGGHVKPAVKPVAVTRSRPPDLIIQDELHLISGALGTMVGLYETAVDALASWTVDGVQVRSKVVASTATVRRAREQVHALFDRDLAVFPPPVLDAGETFFSRQVEVSALHPGRRYLGVCAHGQRLKYIQIRVAQVLMAAGQLLFDDHLMAADAYLTLVDYFSATHELAGMRRMVEDDITTRLRSQDRRGLANRRGPVLEELTSRVSSDAIGRTLQRLGFQFDPAIDTTAAQQLRTAANAAIRDAVKSKDKAAERAAHAELAALPRHPDGQRPIDVLLATSMLQVGVDVSRLGLMVVTGQPKNSAEYIQATSRIGRDPGRPGLVVTLFNWARPRDLAHFETFAHFHETFYARVEALSVTPFAERALDRGLTGVLVSLLRHARRDWEVEAGAQLVPVSDERVDAAIDWIAERAGSVLGDATLKDPVTAQCRERMDRWDVRRKGLESEHLSYTMKPKSGGLVPLLETTPSRWEMFSVGTSLREVESEANLLMHLEAPEVAARPDWDWTPAPATGAGRHAVSDQRSPADLDEDDTDASTDAVLVDELGPVPGPGAAHEPPVSPPATGEAPR